MMVIIRSTYRLMADRLLTAPTLAQPMPAQSTRATVSQPKYELGQAGARALLDRLEPGARAAKRARTITLETSLCLRESCGYERRAARRA